MAGNRRWSEAEDQAIREAAALNRSAGEWIGGRGRAGRLRDVARAFGRSYGAGRNRAARIGAHSRLVGVGAVERAGSQGKQAAPLEGASAS